MDTQSHHAGGEQCLAGTRKVPRGFKACCERFDLSTSACIFDIRFEWWSKRRSWVVRVADGGSSGNGIAFCPYCGAKLSGTATGKARIPSGRLPARKK
jgi:hypothetical protein